MTWTAISGSSTGAAHTDGINQDACATKTVGSGARAGTVLAAVADGHGGARYVRSALGARAAVDAAIAVLAQASVPATAIGPDLARAILSRWREVVLADHATRPFTATEQQALGADVSTEIAYGATLIAVIADATGVGIMQIGDGDVLVMSSSGQLGMPVPGDSRLDAGRTTSLCSPDAATSFRFAHVSDTRWLLMCTDGYGNAFADADWRATVGADLDEALRAHGLTAVARQFPQWLEASATTGGDDASGVLLVDAAEHRTATQPADTQHRGAATTMRSPAPIPSSAAGQTAPSKIAPPHMPAAREAPANSTEQRAEPRPRARPPWPLVLLAAVIGAVIGAAASAAFLLLGRSTPPPNPAPGTTQIVTTEIVTVTAATTVEHRSQLTIATTSTTIATTTVTVIGPASPGSTDGDPGNQTSTSSRSTASSVPSGTEILRPPPNTTP